MQRPSRLSTVAQLVGAWPSTVALLIGAWPSTAALRSVRGPAASSLPRNYARGSLQESCRKAPGCCCVSGGMGPRGPHLSEAEVLALQSRSRAAAQSAGGTMPSHRP